MLHPGGWAGPLQAALEQLAPLGIHQLARGCQQRVSLARFRLPAAAEAHAAFPVQQEGVPARSTDTLLQPQALERNFSMFLQSAAGRQSTPPRAQQCTAWYIYSADTDVKNVCRSLDGQSRVQLQTSMQQLVCKDRLSRKWLSYPVRRLLICSARHTSYASPK